jgi:hypothetical protein
LAKGKRKGHLGGLDTGFVKGELMPGFLSCFFYRLHRRFQMTQWYFEGDLRFTWYGTARKKEN